MLTINNKTLLTRSTVALNNFAYTKSYNYNVIMSEYNFDWDKHKAATNVNKHGVSFEEAKQYFMMIIVG